MTRDFRLRLVGLSSMLVVLPFVASSGGQLSHSSTPLGKTAFVSCYDDAGHPTGSKKVRSAALATPDGRRQAFVVVEAVFDAEAAKHVDNPRLHE